MLLYALIIMERKLVVRSCQPRSLLTSCALFLAGVTGMAQWDLGTSLQLSGTNAIDRQVLGVPDPEGPADAVSLGSARRNTTNRAIISGSTALSGALVPAPAALVPGMIITVLSLEANAAAPTLALNGLSAHPIVKGDGLALDAGDLRPGVPARMIFDGDAFQLISATFLGCPSGYVSVSNTYCIADQPGKAATFYDAIAACGAQGGRLCTISEWSHACSSLAWFFGTVTQAEWVDHAANNNTGAKLVGAGIDGGGIGEGSGCEFGGQSPPTNLFPYRCCYNR